MNDLYRELAPITADAWAAIEDEARQALTATLAGRRLIDFEGPLGWQASSVDLGRTEDVAGPKGAETRLRRVRPLVELRIPFELERREIGALERGARDPELGPVVDAARAAALAEDGAIFNGFAGAGITGIMAGAANDPISLSSDYTTYPEAAAQAMNVLRSQGIAGPYAIALGPRCYAGLTSTTHSGGYPVMEHLRQLVDGPLVYAPAVDGSVVLSLRGDDYQLVVGRDFSIGYLDHDAKVVQLYIESSFTFLNNAPEAAVPLVYGSGGRSRRK
jgi:uncharacterized linocin/CFP29 family protein